MIQRRRTRPLPANERTANLEAQVAAVEADHRQALAAWQCKSLEERGAGISACCQSASAIMETRRQMGLTPLPRQPWPAAIWDMLRKHAADARR